MNERTVRDLAEGEAGFIDRDDLMAMPPTPTARRPGGSGNPLILVNPAAVVTAYRRDETSPRITRDRAGLHLCLPWAAMRDHDASWPAIPQGETWFILGPDAVEIESPAEAS